MNKKKVFISGAPVYRAPRLEMTEKVLEDLLCTSPDGLTEDFGDIEDFTW